MSPAQNTCAVHVGRLLEINVAAGYRSVDDVDHMIEMIRAQIARVPRDLHVVIAADWRAVGVMPPAVADRAFQMLRVNNPRVERSAILTAEDNATTALQIHRLVREAQHAGRRSFTAPEALAAWLDEVLAPDERARLRLALRGG